ncbi:MAG: hypothetical protein QOH63_1454 [Acidobacteriota bacterium]|jgi:hypothetical protein|nr:hypothetical protein [Acidobacteriota bacterium]
MKLLFVSMAVLLLLFSCTATFGQERDLQLTTNIISQQACALNAKLDALQLTLQLRYTNTGSRKLILYKGFRIFYQAFISRSQEEAAAQKYELRTTHARFYDEQPEKIEGAVPGNAFTVLSPRSAYETKQVLVVPVAREGEPAVNSSIAAGEHTLYLSVSTWYESKKLADSLRERWRARGFLWTDTLASKSVNFNVQSPRPAVMCQSTSR